MARTRHTKHTFLLPPAWSSISILFYEGTAHWYTLAALGTPSMYFLNREARGAYAVAIERVHYLLLPWQ